MAKIVRKTGNVVPFGSNSTALNRVVFGGTTQSDTLDDNVNADFLLGWEKVLASGFPPKNWFNAVGFTMSQFIAYLHQVGVPEWDVAQEYYTGAIVNVAGVLYTAVADTTGDIPSSTPAKWKLIVPSSSEASFTASDTTPSVSSGEKFVTANSVLTTYTDFDDGTAGQKISVRCNDAFSVIDGGLTKTGMTIPLIVGDILEFYYDGTNWIQTGGNVGMGVFVPVSPNNISDWIDSTETDLTNVDVSDDGVRKGATSAVIRINFQATAGTSVSTLSTRVSGGSSVSRSPIVSVGLDVVQEYNQPLDDDGIFAAEFVASWVSLYNFAFVMGYYI